MNRRVNIREIAKLANVSISTVSKALNDNIEISIHTRLHVKRIANENDYAPNAIAKALKRKRTGAIGVIIPEIDNSFFSRMVQSIEKQAKRIGVKVYLGFSNESLNTEQELTNSFIDQSVDGVVMSLSKETHRLRQYEHLERLNNQVPLVMANRVCNEIYCDKIVMDDFEASKSVLRHLTATGCRNIAFLSTIKSTSVSKNRIHGINEEFRNLNNRLKTKMKIRIVALDGYGVFEEKMNAILSDNSTDAIILADELSAIKAHGHLLRRGLKIPEEISIIGFSDSDISQNIFPSMTIVSQEAEEMGEKALDLLRHQMTGNNAQTNAKTVTIKHKIVFGESTKKVMGENHITLY